MCREASGRCHWRIDWFGVKNFGAAQDILDITLLGKKNAIGTGNDFNTKEKFERTKVFHSKVRLEIVQKVVNGLIG